MILVALLLGVLGASGAALAQDGQQVAPGATGVMVIVTTLEGAVRMPGVDVELRAADDESVLARTLTDGTGQVMFPDVPPGRYIVRAMRPGLVTTDSAAFEVREGVVEVLVDTQLIFVAPPVEVGAASPSPTNSVQPVTMSDMLSGAVMESAPIEGDDFQSLLPLLPGVVRGPDGRLRIRGGQPSQAALQVSSASLNDPSTGDFDLELPGPSIESVEVLANPFAAEFGRFSTSVTQVRTRSGTNEWEIRPGNFVPRLRKSFGIRAFEPRLSVRGPIQRDRMFIAQDVQFRYVATPVKSLPDEPEIELRSFDSFTRIDRVISARHLLSGALIMFPREIKQFTMGTFRPPEATPDFHQTGWSTGGADRLALSPEMVLETTVALRRFEVEVQVDQTESPMVYAPAGQSGAFFNDQERDVTSFQWVQALSRTQQWRGEHVIKGGIDLQQSRFTGSSASRPVEIRRVDGSLAERTVFGGQLDQDVRGTEFSVFVQDRWRAGSRFTFELGFRMDRDAVVKRVNWSPRAGMAVSVLPDGEAIVRGGFGKFVQRTPLNVEAFPAFESRVSARFDPEGNAIGEPLALVNTLGPALVTPEAYVGNIEWDQRFGRRVLLKLAFLGRRGRHEYVLTPDPEGGQLRLSSTGTSYYKELEATARYVGSARRDITISYVWARGTADLNNYDQFYGNLRNPIVRANEHNLIPTDVRHRLLLRGNIGLPGQWDFAPVIEVRSGFPWSAVDEFWDFVGPRNRSGRLPAVRTVDFQLTRPFSFKGFDFRAGLKMYNAFGAAASRDIQNHAGAADFGTAYNPIERSVGFVFDMGL